MSDSFRTLPGLLKHVEAKFKNPYALGYKSGGDWIGISTQEVGETVRRLSCGMVEMGLKPGEKVGIVADPSPFWMMMDLAILGAGAVSVPMFSNISHENLSFEIQDSGMRFLFVGSMEQYEAMKPFFGKLERIIGKPAIIERHPPRKGDQLATGADVSKLFKHLGWKPTTGIDDGLAKQVEWQRSLLGQ